MFGFKRTGYNDIKALREEGLRIAQENHRLRHKTQKLEEEVAVLHEEIKRLELIVKEYRDLLFKKKALKHKKDNRSNDNYTLKKPGAPMGHEGLTRQIPDRIDEHKDVYLDSCPQCSSKQLTPCEKYYDHYQEDIVIPKTRVIRFRHHYYWCRNCKRIVHGIADNELPASFIGPDAKALAGFLHYQMAVPYRKIKVLFKEMFNMDFNPASCVGFDKQISARGQPLYERLKAELKNKPYIHIDETGWKDKWLWCYADKDSVVYKIEPGRGQKELSAVLGDSFKGVLISDFLGAYNRIKSLKQRCLIHALRLIDKWQVYYSHQPKITRCFINLKTAVKRIIYLNSRMKKKTRDFSVRKADAIGYLRRLLNKQIGSPKADKFRRKLLDHFDELITCLDFSGIPAHNNQVERLLRNNVIMRKITFGNRSKAGMFNHEVIMSLTQTARLKKLNPLSFLYTLLTDKTKAATAISVDLTSAS